MLNDVNKRVLVTFLRFYAARCENLSLRFSCGFQYSDDALYGRVSFVVCCFEPGVWFEGRGGSMVKERVGNRATNVFVEEDKH